MAWQDELWKGRVIDSLAEDNRTDAMGALCPDQDAFVHTPCGCEQRRSQPSDHPRAHSRPAPSLLGPGAARLLPVTALLIAAHDASVHARRPLAPPPRRPPSDPSPAQPDGFVNEEWFGLFGVNRSCYFEADGGLLMSQLVPRPAYERLGLLWRGGGSCVRHYGLLAHTARLDAFPACGQALAGLRERMWARPDAGWDGFDCTLQAALHALEPLTCPAAPEAARSATCGRSCFASIAEERACSGALAAAAADYWGPPWLAAWSALAPPSFAGGLVCAPPNATALGACSCDGADAVGSRLGAWTPSPPDDECKPTPVPFALSFGTVVLIFAGLVVLARTYARRHHYQHRLRLRVQRLIPDRLRWWGHERNQLAKLERRARLEADRRVACTPHHSDERLRTGLLERWPSGKFHARGVHRRTRIDPGRTADTPASGWRSRLLASSGPAGPRPLAMTAAVSAQPSLQQWVRERVTPIAMSLAAQFGFQQEATHTDATPPPTSQLSPLHRADCRADCRASTSSPSAFGRSYNSRVAGYSTATPPGAQAPRRVPSSVDAQLDHVIALLTSEMDRTLGSGEGRQMNASDPSSTAAALENRLARAAVMLHDRTLQNYLRWLRHVKLPTRAASDPGGGAPRAAAARASTLGTNRVTTLGSLVWGAGGERAQPRWSTDEEGVDVEALSATLHRVLLFYLLWGEAANLRHAPECLCFVFYCASHALLRPLAVAGLQRGALPLAMAAPQAAAPAAAPRRGEERRGSLKERPPRLSRAGSSIGTDGRQSHGLQSHGLQNAVMPLPDADYLQRVVTPWYYFLAHEVAGREAEPVSLRIQYDDFNEFFWEGETVAAFLPSMDQRADGPPAAPTRAYLHLRECLGVALQAGRGAHGSAAAMAAHFGFQKTYLERVHPLHAFFSYYRVLIFNAILCHVMIATAFADGRPGWRELSSAVVTHSLLTSLRQILRMVFVPHRKPKRLASALSLAFVFFTIMPVFFLVETSASPPWSVLVVSALPGRPVTLFELLAVLYSVVMTWTNLRWAVFASKSKSFVGDRLQVLPRLSPNLAVARRHLMTTIAGRPSDS